jgi:flagellar protein FliO/FliZ
MYQQFIFIGMFLVGIACLPLITKWLVLRNILKARAISGASKLVSVVAVGPNQRVVTVEVGPEHNRAWLVLGVSPQQITYLHSFSAVFDRTHSQTESTQVVITPGDTGCSV